MILKILRSVSEFAGNAAKDAIEGGRSVSETVEAMKSIADTPARRICRP
ncbi:hypothetical protein [Desulfonema ishimotonii]|nr:hypothetical protein [Desulfonema ishimotonii]